MIFLLYSEGRCLAVGVHRDYLIEPMRAVIVVIVSYKKKKTVVEEFYPDHGMCQEEKCLF